MGIMIRFIHPLAALILSPLLFGIINRVKAIFAGRKGQPLLQGYFDLWKLFHKGAVYSQTTSWVFRLSPLISLAAILIIILMVPFGHNNTLISFAGDIFLIIYLLALMRFFMIIAALDTGSSFEGIGASREAQFSALVEPSLLLALAAMACATRTFSLSDIFACVTKDFWFANLAIILFVGTALFIIMLSENSRIPVDDPNTHLELTMIHEVMVLDYSGPDFGFILYTSALKLWVFASIFIGIIIPVFNINIWLNLLISIIGIFAVSATIGIIESCMARFRLLRVPQFILAAAAFSVLAMVFVLRK